MSSPTRQLAAIMFTDIVGYTALMGQDTPKTLELVRQSKDIQKPLLKKHNGTWLKDIGDGMMSQFQSAMDAVNCALEIQQQAHTGFDGKLRIGIHLGDITIEDDDVYGDGVNVASRLESITDPGGIYISESIEKAIRGRSDVKTVFLGEIHLKNVDYGVRTYALQSEFLPAPEHITSLKGPNKTRKKIQIAVIAFIILTGLISVFYFFSEKETNRDTDKRIQLAVIPFKNLSANPENQYFVDGIMDIILTNISKIEGIDARSRTSVEQYRDTRKTMREIGQELSVDYIVEASVQRFENKITINVQLIDAYNDNHVWSETYAATWPDVIEMEHDLSLDVARAVEVSLTEDDVMSIQTSHNTLPEAHDFLLRAGGLSTGNETDLMRARAFLQEAIKIDSAYIEAWIVLGNMEANIYRMYNRTQDQRDRIENAFNNAIKYSGANSFDAEMVKARYLYFVARDYPAAIKLLQKLYKERPASAALNYLILTYRRLGDSENAVRFAKEKVSLNPEGAQWWYNLGQVLYEVQRYEESEAAFKEVIRQDPGHPEVYEDLSWLYMHLDYDLKRAREIQERKFLIGTRDYWYRMARLETMDRNFEKALEWWRTQGKEGHVGQLAIYPQSLGVALIYFMKGSEPDLRNSLFRSSIETLYPQYLENSNDERLCIALGKASAGIGDRKAANDLSLRAAEIVSVKEDWIRGHIILQGRIEIYLLLGEYDLAINELYKYESNLIVPYLKFHPLYDPLRSHPGFSALMENWL